MSKYLITIFITSIIVAGCSYQTPNDDAPPTSETLPTYEELEGEPVREHQFQQAFTYTASQSGQTAFELLQANAEVEYDEADFGVFVTGINSVQASDTHFWAIYHNEEMALVGASDLELEEGDVVEFRLEEIEF